MHARLQRLIATHAASPESASAVWTLAGFDSAPRDLSARLTRLYLALGALLVGLSAIFWIAANWGDWGLMSRLALLQGSLIATVILASTVPVLRTAALSLGTLLTGALLAYIGQTYQTGADPWQLFAIWAVLCLPWMMAARRDLLWTFWLAIAAVGIGLWVGPRYSLHFGRSAVSIWQLAGPGWLLWTGLVIISLCIFRFGVPGSRAHWSLRFGLVLLLAESTFHTTMGIFNDQPAVVLTGFSILALAGLGLWRMPTLDVGLLGAVFLCVDTVLLIGSTRMLAKFDLFGGGLVLFTLWTACVIGASITLLLRLYRARPQDNSTEDAST